MSYFIPVYKGICVTFGTFLAYSAAGAIINPVKFADEFGIPITDDAKTVDSLTSLSVEDKKKIASLLDRKNEVSKSFLTLTAARSFGTAIIILTLTYRRKWTEVASILSTLCICFAGMDGYTLMKKSTKSGAWRPHIIPATVLLGLSLAFLKISS